MSPDNIGSLFHSRRSQIDSAESMRGRRKSYVIRSALGNRQFEREIMKKREIIKMTGMTQRDLLISWALSKFLTEFMRHTGSKF